MEEEGTACFSPTEATVPCFDKARPRRKDPKGPPPRNAPSQDHGASSPSPVVPQRDSLHVTGYLKILSLLLVIRKLVAK